MNAIQDQNLSATQVIQLTQAMLSVALVDGIHPAEAALIGQFYEGSRSADMPTTATMLSGSHAFDARAMAGCPVEVADTVVLMCLMTGYADGQLSAEERALVQSFATALQVDATPLRRAAGSGARRADRSPVPPARCRVGRQGGARTHRGRLTRLRRRPGPHIQRMPRRRSTAFSHSTRRNLPLASPTMSSQDQPSSAAVPNSACNGGA